MSKTRRILHITNWYPNKFEEKEAMWVGNHLTSLTPYAEQVLYHLEVRRGRPGFHRYKNDFGFSYIMTLPDKLYKWRLVEYLTTLLLFFVLFVKERRQRYSLINFHIAYPLCTYLHTIRKYIKKPMVITEHWSAYHFSFNIKGSDALNRIRKIFYNEVPVICVSQALAVDIIAFSQNRALKTLIVPNVIDTSAFTLTHDKAGHFLMASYWKLPKNPFLVLEAIGRRIKQGSDIRLRVAGYGPLLPDMELFVEENGLQNHISFIGKLDKQEMAREMKKASLFLHPSQYETFSVVCAEALCCGTPVMASSVGGIKEFITENNGLLVDNTVSAWLDAIERFEQMQGRFHYEQIANQASGRFAMAKVGRLYSHALDEVIEDYPNE
ncbi:glycosyltransferase family 4 protein [Roseivirga sp. BDSF3-8]|uniref:glycosyltransferase family 4 protein n=1 Tax=Roseivirga sp. BDSF3-8 TaxID=3241598 RepID=UPI00353262E1